MSKTEPTTIHTTERILIAKKKSQGVNKSQAVRDYLVEHPDATASTILPALTERGIDVSVALVGQIK
jgi:hypothetical protein